MLNTVLDQKLLVFPIVVDGEQGNALIGAEDQLTGGRQGCRVGGSRRRMAIRSGGLNRNHRLGRCDQRGGASATSPGNKSLLPSSGIPHDKSTFAKNRPKFRDLNSHLIPRLYPHFSEV